MLLNVTDRTKWAQVRQNNSAPMYFQCTVFHPGQSNCEETLVGFSAEVFRPTL